MGSETRQEFRQFCKSPKAFAILSIRQSTLQFQWKLTIQAKQKRTILFSCSSSRGQVSDRGRRVGLAQRSATCEPSSPRYQKFVRRSCLSQFGAASFGPMSNTLSTAEPWAFACCYFPVVERRCRRCTRVKALQAEVQIAGKQRQRQAWFQWP